MLKKAFNIFVIAILALNLMGALVFASAFDCGMECCKPGDWAGTTSYEAPSCCQMSDVTCGFEAGQYEELLDTAVCCFNSADSNQLTADSLAASDPHTPAHTRTYAHTLLTEPPPQSAPLYLSNASFLC